MSTQSADYLRGKLNLPTEKWDDIQRSAHDRAFIVAGAQKADLLADFHQAVIRAAAGDITLRDFEKDFQRIVKKHGWTGWTGEGTRAGEAWRARIIYSTNISTSFAAGRYRQLTDPEYLKEFPYWVYHHLDGQEHPRLLHQSWDGLTLHHSHPFWRTHFPPNGWHCHCWVTSTNQAGYERAIRAGKAQLPKGWDTIDPRIGAPRGIDKGFDYAPGASVGMPLREAVQNKLINYPPAIAKALSADVNRYINATAPIKKFIATALVNKQAQEDLFLGFVENKAISQATYIDTMHYMILVNGDSIRHIEYKHSADGRSQRPPTAGDFALLPDIINRGKVSMGETVAGRQKLVFEYGIAGELYHAVFEVHSGKRNRALSLITFFIKRAGGV